MRLTNLESQGQLHVDQFLVPSPTYSWEMGMKKARRPGTIAHGLSERLVQGATGHEQRIVFRRIGLPPGFGSGVRAGRLWAAAAEPQLFESLEGGGGGRWIGGRGPAGGDRS